MQRIIAAFLATALLALPVQAAPSISGPSALYLAGDTDSYMPYSLYIEDASPDLVFSKKNISSSNTKVATVYGYSNDEDYTFEGDRLTRLIYLMIRPIGAGTTTISAKIAGQTLKKEIKVYKYTNPL